jgi:hypothetical protein
MKSLIKTIVMLALLSTAIHANQVDGQTKATKTDSYLNWETLKRPINLFYAASGFVAAKIANWWVRPPAQVMAPSDQTSKGNRVSSLNNLREQALKKLEASLKKPTIASLPGGENKVSDVVAAVASSVGSAAAASIAPAPKSLATRIDDQVKVLNRAHKESS